jgi:hypothetical protein
MKRIIVAAILSALVVVTARSARSEAPMDSTAIVADTSLVFTLVTGSRLYPDWSEEHQVKLHEMFYLGDTEYTAKIEGFMPDFRMRDGEPLNWSMAMANPAAFVVVYADSGAADSTWAFLNFPPHFSPKSFFTFKLTTVDGYEAPVTDTAEEEK